MEPEEKRNQDTESQDDRISEEDQYDVRVVRNLHPSLIQGKKNVVNIGIASEDNVPARNEDIK
jgi:hypothetical protein